MNDWLVVVNPRFSFIIGKDRRFQAIIGMNSICLISESVQCFRPSTTFEIVINRSTIVGVPRGAKLMRTQNVLSTQSSGGMTRRPIQRQAGVSSPAGELGGLKDIR
jgi:hypothetical protein